MTSVFLLPVHSAAATPLGADEKLAKVEAPPLSSTSTVGLPATGISIEAGSDKTTASANLGNVWTSSDGVSVYHWGISAKAPFDSTKDDKVDIGTLSGLTAGSSLKIEGGWFHWPATVDVEKKNQILCKDAIEHLVPGYSWLIPVANQNSATTDPFKYLNFGGAKFELAYATCDTILASYEGLESAIEARNKATADYIDPATGKKPEAEKLPPEAQLPSRAEFDRWSKEYKNNARAALANGAELPMGISISATANRQKFSFADSATAPTKVTSANKQGYGASVTGTLVGPWYVLGAGYEYSRTFKGGTQTQICTPIGTSSATSCANGALAPPTEKIDHILFVEGRMIVDARHRFALSPRVEYGVKTHDYGVQLPIYLAGNKDRILDGGIGIGWTNIDHWGVGIFVGKAFSFF
jgi:hypothetical protein